MDTAADWADWRERLRERPDASDWRAAIGYELFRLQVLADERGSTGGLCGVDEALDTARQAITVRRGPIGRARSWWSGWDAERAWQAVHIAEAILVAHGPELSTRLTGIQQEVARQLPTSDRRLAAVQRINAEDIGPPDGNCEGAARLDGARAVVGEAMKAAARAADDALRRVRILRNQMLLFGGLLLLLNIALGVVGSVNPAALSLCVGQNVCPSGGQPAGIDVWLVQLFGVVGAAVAVVLLLVNRQPKLITYALTEYQSLVKIALGATLAVVGVLALSMGAVTFEPKNPPGLLLIALVFGYAQQIATRFLDNTASNLVSKAKTGATHPAPAE